MMAKRGLQTKARTLYTIGVDLGGTKVLSSLVDSEGQVLAEAREPTVPPELIGQDTRLASIGPSPSHVRRHIAYVVDAIADGIEEVLSQAPKGKLAGVGLASAGPMDLQKGTLRFPANFRGWKVVPLVKLVQDELVKRGIRAPIHFQNDAIAAALGEGWVGRARKTKTYVMVTIGTGIGSGVILNGRPAQSAGMGSEWGHLLVDCRGLQHASHDYEHRTVEGLASGTGLATRARSRGIDGASGSRLAESARRGDRVARELFADASEALAALFYALSLGFHPEKFIISGGMLAIRDCFLPQAILIYREMMKTRYPDFLAPVQVASLGVKAGVIGAARLPLLEF